MRHTRAKCTHSHHKRKGGEIWKLTYQVHSFRTRAAHLLPSSFAQPASVHLPHVAHADDTNALDIHHSDCCARFSACVERGVQPMVEDRKSCSAGSYHFSNALVRLTKQHSLNRGAHLNNCKSSTTVSRLLTNVSQSLIHSHHASQEEGRARCAGEHPGMTAP